MIFAVLTLGSFALLAYAYVGYPGLLWLLSKIIPGRPRRSGEPAEWPRVSIIVSAYNEEHVIANRLQNLHALDYPRDIEAVARVIERVQVLQPIGNDVFFVVGRHDDTDAGPL